MVPLREKPAFPMGGRVLYLKGNPFAQIIELPAQGIEAQDQNPDSRQQRAEPQEKFLCVKNLISNTIRTAAYAVRHILRQFPVPSGAPHHDTSFYYRVYANYITYMFKSKHI